jgi:hypothetical protein
VRKNEIEDQDDLTLRLLNMYTVDTDPPKLGHELGPEKPDRGRARGRRRRRFNWSHDCVASLRQGDSITLPSLSIGWTKRAKLDPNAKVADRDWSEDLEK